VGLAFAEAHTEAKRFFEVTLSHAIQVLGREEVRQIVRSATKRRRQPNSALNAQLLAEWRAYNGVCADKGEKVNKIAFCRWFAEVYRQASSDAVKERLNRRLRSLPC
jgi:hypothetical protein